MSAGAVDNSHMLEILAVNIQEGTSRKTGNAYKLFKAQCVLRGPDNSVQIGEMFLSEKIAAETQPGRYLAEFELTVNYDREVVPRITKLHNMAGSAVKPVPAVAKSS